MADSTTKQDVKKAAAETKVIRRDNTVTRAGVPTYKGDKKGSGAVQNAAKAIKGRKAMLDEI